MIRPYNMPNRMPPIPFNYFALFVDAFGLRLNQFNMAVIKPNHSFPWCPEAVGQCGLEIWDRNWQEVEKT